MQMFTRAIVRPPAPNFSAGLTTADLGNPDYARALEQHARYCHALETCGLELIHLKPDEQHPDSCFVEDVAVLFGKGRAVLTRPGAPSRQGEVANIRETLSPLCPTLHEIRSPGTLDGGDVCEAGTHFFIGLSERTNEAGAHRLANIAATLGYSSTIVDIRDVKGLLHLKSGLAYLDEKRLVVTEALENREEFRGYELIRVDPDEEYAANCIRVNGRVMIAAGRPRFENRLRELGYQTLVLDMSEFQKMDGGLSCLSLRW